MKCKRTAWHYRTLFDLQYSFGYTHIIFLSYAVNYFEPSHFEILRSHKIRAEHSAKILAQMFYAKRSFAC